MPRAFRLWALAFFGVTLIVLGLRERSLRSDGALSIAAFPASDGGGVLLTGPAGRHIVIAPAGEGILESLGRSLPLGDRTIEALILPNASRLSLEAATEIVRRYDVRTVFTGSGNAALQAAAAARATRLEGGTAGTQIDLGDGAMVTVEADRSAAPILLRAQLRNKAILIDEGLTAAEGRILARRKTEGADVLVTTGGHGHLAKEFVSAVHPATVILTSVKKENVVLPEGAQLRTTAEGGEVKMEIR